MTALIKPKGVIHMDDNQKYLSASDVARHITERSHAVVRPRDITDLFYNKTLSDAAHLMVAGRRLIPPDELDGIERALRKKGIIAAEGKEDGHGQA